MNTVPPLPQAPAAPKGLMVSAYICSGLSLIPGLGMLTGLAGIILGILLCTKREVGHGIANIAISGLLGFLLVPIVTIAILTALGGQLKEIHQQVSSSLEAPASQAPASGQ